ncbi:hypothetical protein ACI2KR_07190 [Pseudomonas luteola]
MMKKAKGRFVGGFYGLAPFQKYSEVAPLLKATFAPSIQDTTPKLQSFLSSYGLDKKFIISKTKTGPAISMEPRQGN